MWFVSCRLGYAPDKIAKLMAEYLIRIVLHVAFCLHSDQVAAVELESINMSETYHHRSFFPNRSQLIRIYCARGAASSGTIRTHSSMSPCRTHQLASVQSDVFQK